MEILQNFIFNRTDHKVTILWENGDPLFRASEIGDVLGIKEIRSVVRDFDDDEVQVRTMHGNAGLRGER